jgi:hypothetical protein
MDAAPAGQERLQPRRSLSCGCDASQGSESVPDISEFGWRYSNPNIFEAAVALG